MKAARQSPAFGLEERCQEEWVRAQFDVPDLPILVNLRQLRAVAVSRRDSDGETGER